MTTYWVEIDVHVSEEPHTDPKQADRRHTIAVKVAAKDHAACVRIMQHTLQALVDDVSAELEVAAVYSICSACHAEAPAPHASNCSKAFSDDSLKLNA